MAPNLLQPVNSVFDDLPERTDGSHTHAICDSSSSPTDFDSSSSSHESHSRKMNVKLEDKEESETSEETDFSNSDTNDVNENENRTSTSTSTCSNSEGDNIVTINGPSDNENPSIHPDLESSSAAAAIINSHVIQCNSIGNIGNLASNNNGHHHSYPDDSSSSSSSSSTSSAATATATATATAPYRPPNKGLEVDGMLSKELLQLSFDDRNAINEEIHGVRCMAPTETPELLGLALQGLQRELDAIPYKPAYDRAQNYARLPQFAQTSYVNTNEFRLKFLRCELFDTRRAAVRLIKYLDLMVELYGMFAIQRKVTLKDFSKQEMQILRAGYKQLFPFRDRSGRRVMCIVGNMGIEFDPTLRLKTYFYFWMTASEDVESQQKGVVFLVWPGPNESLGRIPNPTDRSLHQKCNDAAPIRIVAVHFCVPNKPFFHLLRSIMTFTLGLHYRLRLRFHVGEAVELQYLLKSYGIPVGLTPVTDSGNVKTTYLKQWLRLRKIIEVGITPNGLKTNTVSIIECPRSNDVIFRPGTSMLNHPGNVVFRGLIEAKQDRITVKRAEKEEVALEIIHEINQTGGRFLMWDNGGWWSELNDVPLISVKISISYRDFKTKVKTLVQQHQQEQQRKQSKQQNVDCSTFAFIQDDGRKRKRSPGFPMGCISSRTKVEE